MNTVLVVGNLNALDRESVESLEHDGWKIVETHDDEEGIALCRSMEPALALVEVDSPNGEHFDLLPKLRRVLDQEGRIVAVCNQYTDALDDYCESLGANFALPQANEDTVGSLFVCGLLSLLPPQNRKHRPGFATAVSPDS